MKRSAVMNATPLSCGEGQGERLTICLNVKNLDAFALPLFSKSLSNNNADKKDNQYNGSPTQRFDVG